VAVWEGRACMQVVRVGLAREQEWGGGIQWGSR
jgi:hypothetical protein